MLDLVVAILLLPILIPLIAVLCILTMRDGGNGLFGHERVGKNGRAFKCWKIRTMVRGAEEKLRDHLAANPEAALQWEQDFKLDNDPRIMRFGNFLRRTSLDELPQIWNVLIGDMSFVGPRPVVEDELIRYGSSKRIYEAMTPGITGLWQVSGRNEISYSGRVALDVKYWKTMSLWSDVVILVKTFGEVTRLTGK